MKETLKKILKESEPTPWALGFKYYDDWDNIENAETVDIPGAKSKEDAVRLAPSIARKYGVKPKNCWLDYINREYYDLNGKKIKDFDKYFNKIKL